MKQIKVITSVKDASNMLNTLAKQFIAGDITKDDLDAALQRAADNILKAKKMIKK